MPTECQLKSKRTGSGWKEWKDQVWRDWSCLCRVIKHMHQDTQLIIIRSIPFTDILGSGVVILIHWPHMWQSHRPKKNQNVGSFWKDSFCAIFPSVHYCSCKGSQPDLLGATQRLIQRWVLPGLYSGKEWTKVGEWPTSYQNFRVQVQFKWLDLFFNF